MANGEGEQQPPTPPTGAGGNRPPEPSPSTGAGSVPPPPPEDTPFIEGAVDALDDLQWVRFYVKHTEVGAGGKEMRLTYVYRNDSDREHRAVPLIKMPRRVQPNLRVLGREGEYLPVLGSQTCRLIHKGYVEDLLDRFHAALEAYIGEPFRVLSKDDLTRAMGSTTRTDNPEEVRQALDDAIHLVWGVYAMFSDLHAEGGNGEAADADDDEGIDEELEEILRIGRQLVTSLIHRKDLYLPFALLTDPIGPCYPPPSGAIGTPDVEPDVVDSPDRIPGEEPKEDSTDPPADGPQSNQDERSLEAEWPPVTLIEQFIHVGETDTPPSTELDRSRWERFREEYLDEPLRGRSRVSLEFPLVADVDAYHLRLEPVEGTEFVNGLHTWNFDDETFRAHNQDPDTEEEVFAYEQPSTLHLYRTGDQFGEYEQAIRQEEADIPEGYRDHLWTHIQVQETGSLRWLFAFCCLTLAGLGTTGVAFLQGWLGAKTVGAIASLLIPTALAAVLTLVGQSLSRPFSQRILPQRLILIVSSFLAPLALFYIGLLLYTVVGEGIQWAQQAATD